jgi:hypothetical protein
MSIALELSALSLTTIPNRVIVFYTVPDAMHTNLAAWGNFYLVTASAAAALTGLQFIVQTLMASESLRGMAGRDPEAGVAAFATPTVVHFALAMVTSAVLCAPWPTLVALQLTLGAITVGALGYLGVIFRRARRQKVYKTTTYDWVWYLTFPTVAYTVMLVAVLAGAERGAWPPFLMAAGVLLLLCVGIHNSWDTVTYMTIMSLRGGTLDAATDDGPADAE